MTAAKLLFDAIRQIKGKALTAADVTAVNTVLASVPLPPPAGQPALAPSAACARLIKGFEQCRLTAYLPTPDDVPTIGWGTTGPGIRLGLVWTQAQADTAFAADLDRFGGTVAALLGVPAQRPAAQNPDAQSPWTTQGQYDAMVSLAYNIGTAALGNSTLLRLHLAGRYAEAADQFPRWNKQAGKVLNGLTRRRAVERAMYLGAADAKGVADAEGAGA
ncbi:lysozyme [Sphingomonas sp. So64.6b]|uniref:lysozyme n=1 Tax=Sphingomonas sp. So64.6b TaxID=2997354 RepID=UPI0015FFC644|nr:lysozyme [Sphingomonas sp. So64.6b]QNA85134.1 lysozyme [Sphingomonas sp. So64.6b]